MIKKESRLFAGLLPVIVALVSCAGGEKKLEKISADSLAVYSLRPNRPLSDKEKQRISDGVQLFCDTLLFPSNFNGGILVAKGGNIIFEKYTGSGNLDGRNAITDSTPMHVASVSKTFTAMAIMKLQEQGKLNIEDPVSKYFPEFNYGGVTIKTLLNHRSGLPNYLYFMETAGWDKKKIIKNEDILQWLIIKKNEIKNIGAANVHFTYCNTNYALLALIIEKITRQPFPQFMQQNVFTPLGMKNSFFHFNDDGRVLPGSFDRKGGRIPDNFLDGVYGDKNLYTTPRDLLIWDRALSDTIFISARSLDSAYMPYSNEKPGIRNYGLGWHMYLYPGEKKIIYHNGWWHGSNAAFIRPVENDAVIIVIGNRYTSKVYKAKFLANLFEHYFDADIDDEETKAPGPNLLINSDSLSKKASSKALNRKKSRN